MPIQWPLLHVEPPWRNWGPELVPAKASPGPVSRRVRDKPVDTGHSAPPINWTEEDTPTSCKVRNDHLSLWNSDVMFIMNIEWLSVCLVLDWCDQCYVSGDGQPGPAKTYSLSTGFKNFLTDLKTMSMNFECFQIVSSKICKDSWKSRPGLNMNIEKEITCHGFNIDFYLFHV